MNIDTFDLIVYGSADVLWRCDCGAACEEKVRQGDTQELIWF